MGRVIDDAALAYVQRASIVVDATTVAGGGRVVDEGAAADGHRASIIGEATTICRRPLGNGESLEREGDAAVHDEDLYTVVAIEGDLLPVTVQRDVCGNGQRLGEQNISTTAKDDGFSVGRGADRHLQLRLIATIGDDNVPTRSGMDEALPWVDQPQQSDEQGQG